VQGIADRRGHAARVAVCRSIQHKQARAGEHESPPRDRRRRPAGSGEAFCKIEACTVAAIA